MRFSVLRGLRMVRATMFFCVVVYTGFYVNKPVWALSVEGYSRAEMLTQADQIFVGTVLAAKGEWCDERRLMIETRYSVRIDEVLDSQGTTRLTAGQVTELVFKGGTVGQDSIDIPGVPRFQPGDSAVFLLKEDGEAKLSPVVGVNQGLYSITGEKDKIVRPYNQGSCCAAHAKSARIVPEAGVPLQDFVRQVKQEIPLARSRKADVGPTVEVPSVSQATHSAECQIRNDGKNRSVPMVTPNAQYLPEDVTVESAGISTRYAWLPWGSSYERPGPIVFNISPAWNSAYREQAIEALSRWNQYADVFDYTELEQPYGPRNKRNEIVWDTVANIRAKYNYDASDVFGVMIPFATSGRVTETDILIPIDSVSWALDFETSWDSVWNGGSQFKPYMLATLLHEIGHSFGREHTFNESKVDWLSTMDYGPSWFRSLRHIVYSDDAASVRARYAPRNIADAGLFLYYADDNLQGNSKYKMSAVSSYYVKAGDTITVDKFVIENIGNQPMTDLRIQWQLRDVNGPDVYNGDYQVLDGTLPVDARWPMENLQIALPSTAPTGTYQLYARLDYGGENVSDAVEYNNLSMIPTRINVSNGLPDLRDGGEALRHCSPMSAFPGQTVSVECEIENVGISPSGNFKVAFYAFSMTDESAAYMLGYVSMNSLKPGKKSPCRFEGNFPTHGKAGQYLVYWDIDYDGVVPETDEDNNIAWKEGYVLEIAERPDLDLKFSVVHSTMKIKKSTAQIKGDVVVTNVGAFASQPCQMGVYCLDYARGTLVKLQDIPIPALASNEQVTLKPGMVTVQSKSQKPKKKVKQKKVKFSLEEDFSPTDKYLALIIDDKNVLPESSKENNFFAAPVNGPKKKKK